MYSVLFALGATVESEQVERAALEHFSAVCDYSSWLLNKEGIFICDDAVECTISHSLVNDPVFRERHLKGVLEMKQLMIDAKSLWDSDPGIAQAIVFRAFNVIAESPGLERILGVTTKHTFPDCVRGTSWLVEELRRAGSPKVSLHVVEGLCNHYLHNTNPGMLWQAII